METVSKESMLMMIDSPCLLMVSPYVLASFGLKAPIPSYSS